MGPQPNDSVFDGLTKCFTDIVESKDDRNILSSSTRCKNDLVLYDTPQKENKKFISKIIYKHHTIIPEFNVKGITDYYDYSKR